MWAHMAALHSVNVCLVDQFKAIVQDKIGLPEGVRVIGYRSL